MPEFRRGFKKQAEALARQERADLGLTPLDPLNPWNLARQHGVEILTISELAAPDTAIEQAIVRFLTSGDGSFSAMLLPVGPGVCMVENDSHAMTRRRSNICHEFGHLFLEHEFGHVSIDDRCRTYDARIEDEALWLGGELLVPNEGAVACAKRGLSDHEVANIYRVSIQLAAMRMNASGARIRASRSRSA